MSKIKGIFKLFKTKRRVVTDYEAFTEEEFTKALRNYKPSEIFCPEWSTKQPFLELKKFTKAGCLYRCTPSVEKEFYWLPYVLIYRKHRNEMRSLQFAISEVKND